MRLVPITTRLSQLGSNPSVEFQTGLEQRLTVEVENIRKAQRTSVFGRFGRLIDAVPALRLVTAILVIAFVFAGTGVRIIQASDESLPDNPLYQVKTAREWVELMLARSAENRVGVHARQIVQRGRELESAVQKDKPRVVVELLAASLAISTDRIVDQAVELHSRGKPEPVDKALTMVRTMQRQVDRLRADASPFARPALRKLRLHLEKQERRLVEVNEEKVTR